MMTRDKISNSRSKDINGPAVARKRTSNSQSEEQPVVTKNRTSNNRSINKDQPIVTPFNDLVIMDDDVPPSITIVIGIGAFQKTEKNKNPMWLADPLTVKGSSTIWIMDEDNVKTKNKFLLPCLDFDAKDNSCTLLSSLKIQVKSKLSDVNQEKVGDDFILLLMDDKVSVNIFLSHIRNTYIYGCLKLMTG